ncbi:MAG: DinB family protein [Alphaproteobacteria bacterium]|nr:DinB family protein [Alphaproteobacteria bacterium]
MDQTEMLKTLTRYNAWANAELLEAVRGLPAGEATRPRPGLFRTIVNTLNHPLVTDRMWWAHLHGEAHGHKALNEVIHADFEDLVAARTEMDVRIIGYADALSPEAADEPVSFTLLSGAEGTMSRAMILMHMVNHNSYHRGFVVETFCQIPAPLPLIDLPIFLRGAGGLTTMPPHLKPVTWS